MWQWDRSELVDVRVAGAQYLLVGFAEFFVEFLAWASAGDLDWDVDSNLVARQADHALRQVHDPNRLSHVQHEYLAASRQHRRLQDKLDCLCDAHEEPGHPGVGDRDGATVCD